ncbi:alanine racemase [Fodinibius sp. AD559]|uniref:alanine racemase n=1 Tax=Fodinibius sp. AD559 TaxID=3424179 RepID=UPI0040468914
MIQKSNATVEINLSQLKQNLQTLRSYLDEDTRVMSVVKADAYGHGAVEVAGTLEPMVEAFAVNDIHEGIELRKQDITKPILVFEVPQKTTASQYRVHNLTATVSAKEHFDWLPNGTSYHLNFDTGMGRLGFAPEEAEHVLSLMEENNNLFCTGLYSHFATADSPGSDFVTEQHRLFTTIREQFPQELSAHIANTGATAFYSSEQFDMVRLGIGLYGYAPGKTDIEGISPILQWNSKLVQVKPIIEQSTVSYGATWQAPADGNLGIIPVGYDDGLKRSLSEELTVRIDGVVYPLVGTITMNYCMVFLGDDQYKTGTPVELLYTESNARDWASKIDTIPYEILTSINPKISREYIL